ncbi:hypothetical protein [Methylobacterium sp. PvR107]|uniref:hypothetical protein n=1 Tax=Methylobacterium sp. PvR107 TaxID=2806597 RepID=UPI001AE817AD|nr:hypothetical protein [Methylobacterium sp. PvR107]MBP1179999.1 hypothetical protein [Methylobacterium sp. PvR107]
MSNPMLGGSVAPYTHAETCEAASWVPYVEAAIESCDRDPSAAILEAIDKAQRRACLSVGAAALLAEIFDITQDTTFACA